MAQAQYGRNRSARPAKTSLSTPQASGRCSAKALQCHRDMAIQTQMVNSKNRICTPDLSGRVSLAILRTKAKTSWCVLDLYLTHAVAKLSWRIVLTVWCSVFW